MRSLGLLILFFFVLGDVLWGEVFIVDFVLIFFDVVDGSYKLVEFWILEFVRII